MPSKQEYLVFYDYGMGGVWAIAAADSREEICAKLPELTIVESKPDWMSNDRSEELRQRKFVVSDLATYPEWLQTVISERE